MKDLAFGAATFRDPTAGFGSALICVFLHFHLSLATTKRCNNIFPPLFVGLWGAGLKPWGFQHLTFLLTLISFSLWSRLFWQCCPVRSTVTSVLGTDIPTCSSNSPCQPCTPSQRLPAGCCLHVLSGRCWCWRWHLLLLSLNWHWVEVGFEELAEVVCLWWVFSSIQLLTHAGDSCCFPPETVEVSPVLESLPRWWHDFKVLSRQVPVWISLSWTGGTPAIPCL